MKFKTYKSPIGQVISAEELTQTLEMKTSELGKIIFKNSSPFNLACVALVDPAKYTKTAAKNGIETLMLNVSGVIGLLMCQHPTTKTRVQQIELARIRDWAITNLTGNNKAAKSLDPVCSIYAAADKLNTTVEAIQDLITTGQLKAYRARHLSIAVSYMVSTKHLNQLAQKTA